MNTFEHNIYLINKPRGRSSFSIVAQVRRMSGVKKVGHAGTLDPEAEGLLIILVGKDYTKQSDKFLKLDKVYEFGLQLGSTSTTGDTEGEITHTSDTQPSRQQIEEAIHSFVGTAAQTPPIYSAIKIDGVRAYKRARKGEEITLPERTIHIYSLEILDYTYPQLKLRAHVSSGTYIRTLGAEIGQQLQVGAYCQSIVRTAIGKYKLVDAITLP